MDLLIYNVYQINSLFNEHEHKSVLIIQEEHFNWWRAKVLMD